MSGLVRGDDETASVIVESRIEIQHDIVRIYERRDKFIAKAEIHGQFRSHLPIILEKISLFPVVDIHDWAGTLNKKDS